jgi:type I restriction enzyme S subunit
MTQDTTNKHKLPKGWVWTTIGEIRLDRSRTIVPSQSPNEVFELYSVPSFGSGKPEIVAGRAIGSNKQTVEKDTVLLCKINPRINRVWLVSDSSSHLQIASTEWLPFFRLDGLEPKYLQYFMENNSFRDFLSTHVSGVGGSLMRINSNTFAKYFFPLPPLPEQHRIVAKIEELFSRLDAGVEALNKIKLQLKRYRQAVLKAAFEGKLTAEWREVHKSELEPASVLLEKIKAERKKAGKYKELPPLDTSDLPELPEGWVWSRLDAIVDLKGGITVDAKRKVADGRLVPYLRVANVQSGYLDLSEIKSIAADEKTIAELSLKVGDILFTEGGDRDKLGRGWIWQGELEECIHQNHVFRARLYDNGISNKLVSWFGNSHGREYFQQEGKQTTNLASVNLTKLSAFPVVMPPVYEQSQIVSEIEHLFSNADRVENIFDQALIQSNRLRQSILKKAFEGKLAPQDPNDEPAEKLPERIKADKVKNSASHNLKSKIIR